MAEAIDQNREAVLHELRVLLKERRLGAFARLLNQAAAQHSECSDIWRLSVDYHSTTGNPNGCIKALLHWAAVAPKDPEPRLRLADLFERHNEIDGALEALTLAQEAGADGRDVAIRRLKILLAKHLYSEAAGAAETMQGESEGDSPTGVLLAGLRTLARNLAAAAARSELHEMVQRMAGQSADLQADGTGLLLPRKGVAIRLKRAVWEPGLVEHLLEQIRTRSSGCVIGSSNLLNLAGPVARVHDGSFWGSRSRVYVVECDEDMLTLALATFDVRGVLTDEAVTWLWGPAALEQLERYLLEREEESPQNITVSSNPQVAPVVDKASQVFPRKVEALFRESSAYYASLPREHWGDVLGDSPSRPPRILLITTEFSSFLKYSIRDLASAFERVGWQVQVAKESQPTQRMTGLTVPKAVATFRPDLIWQINYLRSTWQRGVPDGVPFVCWDQDAMSHLASSEQATQMGKFDFLACLGSGVGYIQRYGYPSAQLLHLPMCVDRAVFRSDPTQEVASRVTYVSHHGWTLENRIDKILANSPPYVVQRLRPIMREYAARLDGLLLRDGYPLRKEHARQVLAEALQRHRIPLLMEVFESLQDRAYQSLPNTIWRHQALRMAGACGLDLALYGLGWDHNPEFCQFAKGVVEHGKPLADVFQSSRVALQATLAGNEHQRLWEAAACGAVVLMRYHPGDELYGTLREWMDRFEKGLGRRVEDVIPQDLRVHPVGRYVYEFVRIGLAGQGGILDESVLSCLRHAAQFASVRDKLVDVYDVLVFRNQQDLKEKVDRVLTDDRHAQWLRERLEQAVSTHHDYDTQIPRLVRQIRERLLA